MASNEATKQFSSKQEHAIAYELNWDVVSGSGSRPCVPGDVIGEDWLGECKTHVSSGHPIQFMKEVWDKIKLEAMSKHRAPVLFVDEGSQRLDRTWALCYKHSLQLAECLIVDFNKPIRKNISFKSDEGQSYLDEAFKENAFGFLQHTIYEANWAGDEVIIMPFNAFKELFNQ